MDIDELRDLWRSQDASDGPPFDEDAILRRCQSERRRFNRTIVWRDLREVGAAILVAAWFIFCGSKSWPGGGIWTFHLTAASALGVSAFFIIDRVIQRRRAPLLYEAPGHCIAAYHREVTHQIWLLRNVLWWYLLPVAIGISLPLVQMTYVATRGTAPWLVAGVMLGVAVICAVVYYGIYQLNQHAVRTDLEPRRARLEALLHDLVSEEG